MNTSTVNNANTTTVSTSNTDVENVIQGINFYTICFEISSWTSERSIAPEEMEQFASSGVPTPVLDALREKKLGKGRITTYDPDALKIFDAYRGRIRDKLRDLNSFPLMGGSYVFCDEAKYREALAFIADQEPLYWKDFAEFQKNYDTVLNNYLAANPQHRLIIESKLIPKEWVFRKFSYNYMSYENILPAQGKEKLFEVIFSNLKEYLVKRGEENAKKSIGARAMQTLMQRCINVTKEFVAVKPKELTTLIGVFQQIQEDVANIAVADRKTRFKEICRNLADENWLDAAMTGQPTSTAQEAPEQQADTTTSAVQSPVQTGWQNSMW